MQYIINVKRETQAVAVVLKQIKFQLYFEDLPPKRWIKTRKYRRTT